MLVIRIELWPKGDHTRARELGVATISNIGGTPLSGNYEAVLLKSAEYSTRNATRAIHERATRPKRHEIWRRGGVEDFDRASNRLGPWDLLARALVAMLRDRNPMRPLRDEEAFGGGPVPTEDA